MLKNYLLISSQKKADEKVNILIDAQGRQYSYRCRKSRMKLRLHQTKCLESLPSKSLSINNESTRRGIQRSQSATANDFKIQVSSLKSLKTFLKQTDHDHVRYISMNVTTFAQELRTQSP
jgi:hypothetical protein